MNPEVAIPLFMSVVFGLAFVYPYLLYPLLLRCLGSVPIEPDPDFDPQQQRCALLFCAYNEAETLPEKIENLRAIKARCPRLAIWVYSDCSDDGTDEILSAAGDVLHFVRGTERLGKTLGMHTLVGRCEADYLVLTDANTRLVPESIIRLIGYLGDPNVGAVSGRLHYIADRDDDREAVARVGGLYWRLEEAIKRLETRSGSMMGADGALFAIRRRDFRAMPPNVSDDLGVSLSVLFDGKRCVSATDVLAYEYAVADSTEEFARKRRITCGSYGTHLYYLDRLSRLSALDRFKWWSHRVCRWWGGASLVLCVAFGLFASFGAGRFPEALLVLASIALLLETGRRLAIPGLSSVAEILLAIVAMTLGVVDARRGRSHATWKPASSR